MRYVNKEIKDNNISPWCTPRISNNTKKYLFESVIFTNKSLTVGTFHVTREISDTEKNPSDFRHSK